jgi:hypothetical protein
MSRPGRRPAGRGKQILTEDSARPPKSHRKCLELDRGFRALNLSIADSLDFPELLVSSLAQERAKAGRPFAGQPSTNALIA